MESFSSSVSTVPSFEDVFLTQHVECSIGAVVSRAGQRRFRTLC